jgi:hypothetical protein
VPRQFLSEHNLGYVRSRLVFAVLVLVSSIYTLPNLLRMAREAWTLKGFSYTARRMITQPTYAFARGLRATVGPDQILAIVAKSDADVDVAVFLNYDVYPLPTRLYRDLGGYRLDPAVERVSLLIDGTRSPVPRLLTYEQMRAEEIGPERLSRDDASRTTSTHFLVPLAASVDGPPPDMYTTEAVVENPRSAEVEISFELLPGRRASSIRLAAHERRQWSDLVYQVFGVMDQGWMRITASHDVTAGFWLANRGRRHVSILRDLPPAPSARLDLPHDARVWIINPLETSSVITVNDEVVVLEPLGRWSSAISGTVTCASSRPFVAFGTWRDEHGTAHFTWPRAER